jgi:hypothetical protein
MNPAISTTIAPADTALSTEGGTRPSVQARSAALTP